MRTQVRPRIVLRFEAFDDYPLRGLVENRPAVLQTEMLDLKLAIVGFVPHNRGELLFRKFHHPNSGMVADALDYEQLGVEQRSDAGHTVAHADTAIAEERLRVGLGCILQLGNLGICQINPIGRRGNCNSFEQIVSGTRGSSF